jgi:hypothetical protein
MRQKKICLIITESHNGRWNWKCSHGGTWSGWVRLFVVGLVGRKPACSSAAIRFWRRNVHFGVCSAYNNQPLLFSAAHVCTPLSLQEALHPPLTFLTQILDHQHHYLRTRLVCTRSQSSLAILWQATRMMPLACHHKSNQRHRDVGVYFHQTSYTKSFPVRIYSDH